MQNLTLTPVIQRQQFRDFIDLPWRLFGHQPNWVPPLKLTIKNYLDTRRNPFYQHSLLKLWNVYQGRQCVGRIAGIIDHHHNDFHQEKVVFWGFFEALENEAVSRLLFNAVADWGREQGMDILRGPMNPSTNHECGLQISGFDTEPYFMMTANPPYYGPLVEQFGFLKAKDIFAWKGTSVTPPMDSRTATVVKKKLEKSQYTFRTINMKDFKNETERLFEIYNDAWENNWGFVPMNKAEFSYMAKELKAIVNPELCFIVEIEGRPVGFSLTLPNLNQVLKNIRNGKLLPFGLLKLLWHTKIRPSITTYRVVTLGVKRQHQPLGLAAVLYLKTKEALRKLGAREAECSWILEDNYKMNAALERYQLALYKTYRIYEKAL